jgi:outer membrane immunogenic protein
MKRILSAAAFCTLALGPALAADLPPAPPPPPRAPAVYVPVAVPLYNWTGFYFGPNIGWGWTSLSVNDTLGNSYSNSTNQGQFFGGGQVGFNYQFPMGVVIGAEWQFDWLPNASNTGNGTAIPGVGTIQVTSNNRWVTDVAARLGYGWDRVLFYGKGGWAWAGTNGSTINNTTTNTSFTGGTSSNQGWLAGAGIEYAFFPNWTARVEYDYIRLNNTTQTIPAGAAGFAAGDTFNISNRNFSIVEVGMNYKFGW